MAGDTLTIAFWPESALGPTNNCIGVADVLRRRGHRIAFIAESSWRGRLAALGFEEHLVDLAEPADEPQEAGAFWKEFIAATAPEFRKPTVEQLSTVIRPIWEGLVDGARYSQQRLAEVLDAVEPDVVVEDNVVAFPALLTSGAPFVRVVSCNPLEIKDPLLPPPFSGLPSDDPTDWAGFRKAYDRSHRDLWEDFNAWVVGQGAPALEELEFIHTSDHLNLYVYPQAADYQRSRWLGSAWQRMDSSVRAIDEPFEVPEEIRDGAASLIYLSLGSLGSADVALMERLVSILADTPHRYIVSKGPLHAEYALADNMWGAEVVPQVSVLPQVDLVITHGGNNTVTEALQFGKPMVLLPLFWDQYDNAQRMHELGFGIRLDTYGFAAAELPQAVDRLLADGAVRAALARNGERIRGMRGSHAAATLIEEVARRR